MGKQAVMLIVDANSSMATGYGDACKLPNNDDKKEPSKDSDHPSRFDSAVQVAKDLICDLMIQSKTNEVGVVVLKSPTTCHHFYEPDSDMKNNSSEKEDEEDIPFANVLEFSGGGESTILTRPTPDILRKLACLQVTPEEKAQNLRGDFCDGIIVATDSLYRRTNKKKYQRRIILITDAEHKVEVDPQQLSVVLDSLNDLECELNVIGLDFEKQGSFEKPKSPSGTTTDTVVKGNDNGMMNKRSETYNGSDTEDENSSGSRDDESENDSEDDFKLIKSQNESLLINLTRKTGGYVMAAKDVQSIMQKIMGKRKPKSARRKIEFEIAPGLSVNCRASLLLSKQKLPTLKKKVLIDKSEKQDPFSQHYYENDESINDNTAGEFLADFRKEESHYNAQNEGLEITDRGRAYRYGNDLVPMGGFDLTGLQIVSDVKLKVLGYISVSKIPKLMLVGPPQVLTGANSRRACAAISAMARALHRKKHVAIGTFVKTKNVDPVLVGIFPMVHDFTDTSKSGGGIIAEPIYLVVMQLPYRGDAMTLTKPNFDDIDQGNIDVCGNLIDALMIDDNDEVLDYQQMSNPLIRSFWKTIIERVMNPEHDIVSVRNEQEDDMKTPDATLEKARPALNAFYDAFRLPTVPSNDAEKKN